MTSLVEKHNMLNFLESAIKQFRYYKSLGDRAIEQATDETLHWQYNAESNSIAIIVKHLWGNMRSRWTDFLTTDGEKPWRLRDEEFENEHSSREKILHQWEEGWNCLFTALENLTAEDLSSIVYIRNEGHTVMEAINRQLAHYPYHVGQIVYLARMQAGNNWQSLSIPKNQSQTFNEQKFSKEKKRRHFTNEN